MQLKILETRPLRCTFQLHRARPLLLLGLRLGIVLGLDPRNDGCGCGCTRREDADVFEHRIEHLKPINLEAQITERLPDELEHGLLFVAFRFR